MPRFFREVVWHPQSGMPFYRNLSSRDFANLRDAFEKKKRLTKMLFDAGAELRLGTDAVQPFVVPGVALQEEMRIFASLGIPLTEIWDMATRKAGIALNKPELGVIKEGAAADLLIFRRDPTLDLDALNSLEAVVSQGRLYRIGDLREAIRRWQGHFDGVVFDRLSVTAAPVLLKFSVKRDY
jgi:imidazolonepropionase-like amidohydrolase